MNYSARSWREFWFGLAAYEIWFNLSVIDIISRYRRTLLGPFWHVLSHAATIIGLSILYSRVFHQDSNTYLLYVSSGLTVWSLIVLPFTDGPSILIRASQLIHAYDMPVSMHIMRAVSGYFLMFLHNMVVFVAVVLFTRSAINLDCLYFFPAIAVILVAGAGLSFMFSVYGARFRDLGPAATMVTSILFLLTPIFWNKTQSLGVEWISNFNPFYHFIEIARAAMLGKPPNPTDWIVSASIAGILFLAGAISVAHNRSNVTYWV